MVLIWQVGILSGSDLECSSAFVHRSLISTFDLRSLISGSKKVRVMTAHNTLDAHPSHYLVSFHLKRAAFMCGREPNFELSEEEKQELSRYKWEEFLAITRNAITTKKHHRRIGGVPRRKRSGNQVQVSNGEQERGSVGSSMSDDEDEETSAS